MAIMRCFAFACKSGFETRPPTLSPCRLLRNIHQGVVSTAAALQAGSRDADVTGFLMHPALLDSCLQLGALVPESSPAPAAGSAFVPAGLAVYLVRQPLKQSSAGPLMGLVRASPESARWAAAATYRDHLLLDGSGGVVAVLDGLEAKPLHGGAGKTAAAAKAAQLHVLYEVGWAVSGSAAELAPTAAVHLAAGSSVMRLSNRSALAAAADALCTLQRAQQQQVACVQLHSMAGPQTGCLARPSSSGSSGAPLWGLLRAFAQEAPLVGHGGIQTDPHAPQHAPATIMLSSQPAAGPSDGYGALATGGAAMHAVLLPSAKVQPAQGPYHLMPKPRGAFGNLVPEAVPVGACKPGWVEVAVKAVGINFRWVRHCHRAAWCLMHAFAGLYPEG